MTEKTLTEIQFQILKTYVDDPVRLEEHIDLILQYKYDLLDISGYLPGTDVDEGFSPEFISIDGNHLGIDNEIHVLSFFMKGTESEFYERDNDEEVKLQETNIFMMNNAVKNGLGGISPDECYFRIKYSLDKENQKSSDDTLVISISDLAKYAKTIVALSNVTEVDESVLNLWLNVPLVKLRSQIYQYGMQHEDIEKIWLSIISMTLYVHLELKDHDIELQHQQAIEAFVQPELSEQLVVSIENLKEDGILSKKENFNDFDHSAILYNRKQWHFWLFRWFRVRAKTPMITIKQN